jgi:hypothetical protein
MLPRLHVRLKRVSGFDTLTSDVPREPALETFNDATVHRTCCSDGLKTSFQY